MRLGAVGRGGDTDAGGEELGGGGGGGGGALRAAAALAIAADLAVGRGSMNARALAGLAGLAGFDFTVTSRGVADPPLGTLFGPGCSVG
jgi:hypothetical protein